MKVRQFMVFRALALLSINTLVFSFVSFITKEFTIDLNISDISLLVFFVSALIFLNMYILKMWKRL